MAQPSPGCPSAAGSLVTLICPAVQSSIQAFFGSVKSGEEGSEVHHSCLATLAYLLSWLSSSDTNA